MKTTIINNIKKAQDELNELLANVSEDEIPVDTMLRIKRSLTAINSIETNTDEVVETSNVTGKFFEFSQNNTGGSFDVDDKVCHRLFIEANTANEAKSKAMELGVYFDGVSLGIDCSCCGDRWSSWMDDDDVITYPHKYSDSKTFNTVEEHAQYLADDFGWTTPDARIFYKSGKVIEINGKSR